MTNMNLLHVDQEKCTRCGVCAAVCPRSIINIGELGPEMEKGESWYDYKTTTAYDCVY
jgi:ferredoxin